MLGGEQCSPRALEDPATLIMNKILFLWATYRFYSRAGVVNSCNPRGLESKQTSINGDNRASPWPKTQLSDPLWKEKFIFTGAKYSQYFYLLCEMWIFSCSLLWKSQFWLASLVLCAPRHGYYGTSGPPAPAKALTDLKLHLTNSSHPISSSSSTDMVVIHPGAVLAMVDLLPSVSSDSQPEVRKWKAMCFLSKWVKGFDGRQEVSCLSQTVWVSYICVF